MEGMSKKVRLPECKYCAGIQVNDRLLIMARAIAEEVGWEHELKVDEIYSPHRYAYIIAARLCAIVRMRDELDMSLKQIGQVFGKHHSTVIHALQRNGTK